jgi:CHAT domain-containing protein/tetratricopeptide (TPR) repeat protein
VIEEPAMIRSFRPLFSLVLGSVVLVGASSPATAADPKVNEFNQAKKDGDESLKKKDWLAAAQAYDRYVTLANEIKPTGWDKKAEADWDYTVGKNYLRARGHADEGEASLRKALSLFDNLSSNETDAEKKRLARTKTATVRNDLGVLNKDRGRYRQAEQDLKEAIGIWRELKNRPRLAENLNQLGIVYGLTAHFKEAKENFDEAITLATAEDEAAHTKDTAKAVAECINNDAWLYRQMGELDKATSRYEEARKKFQEQGARLEEALCQHNLGWVTFKLGDYDQAEKYYKDAQATRQALKDQLPADDYRVIQTACGLGLVYLYRKGAGDLKTAQELYKRTEDGLGDKAKKEPHAARLFNSIGDLHQELGKVTEARKYYQRAEEVWQLVAKDSDGSLDEALTLGRLGRLSQADGDFAKADKLYGDALKLRGKLPENHPDVAMSLDNLAGVYAAQGRWNEATQKAEQARKNLHSYVRHILPVQAEEVQLSFLRLQHEEDLHAALSMGWARRSDPEMARTTAGWLVNSKGLVHEALAERGLLERADTGDARRAGLARQLTEVRQRLSALTFGDLSSKELIDNRQKEMKDLSELEKKLSKQLIENTGRRPETQNWVNLEEVRQGIPADATLIEIVRLRVWGFQVKGTERVWQDDHYVAWLIPPAGSTPVRVVDLGEATRTDQAVQKVREAFQAATKSYEDDGGKTLATEESEEAKIRGPLQKLADLILTPLIPHLDNCGHLIIGGDGDLWLVPWAALPLGKGYAVERFKVTYVITGRDLVGRKTQVETTAPVVFAAPDYDLNGGRPPASRPKLKRLVGYAEPLENSLAEGKAIIPSLQKFTGKDARLVDGAKATKEEFKKVVRPDILFVSTHGFALGDKDADDKLLPPSPWLRSGLAFAGCNRPVVRKGDDDGILTAKEILGMDLRGTRLVALSACQTGLGKVVRGDGVRGLHQAFQLAGAKMVLATLWSVPDDETRGLTTAMFSKLAKNKGRFGEALREAQLDAIKTARVNKQTTHPFFWGAFTLTGVDSD